MPSLYQPLTLKDARGTGAGAARMTQGKAGPAPPDHHVLHAHLFRPHFTRGKSMPLSIPQYLPLIFRRSIRLPKRKMANIAESYNGKSNVLFGSIVPLIIAPPSYRLSLTLFLSNRNSPDRCHRRDRPPASPFLYTCCNPQSHYTMGPAILANFHLAPSIPDRQQANPRGIHLSSRPPPRTRSS